MTRSCFLVTPRFSRTLFVTSTWILYFLVFTRNGNARGLNVSVKCSPRNTNACSPLQFPADLRQAPEPPLLGCQGDRPCLREQPFFTVSRHPTCLGSDLQGDFTGNLREVDLKRQQYGDNGVLLYNKPYRVGFQRKPKDSNDESQQRFRAGIRQSEKCPDLSPAQLVHLDVEELIECAGFTWEKHTVVTEDSYILILFRVVNRDMPVNTSYPPVFFQHGLFGTAADWLMLGPKNNLPYMCSNQGFDVWLGNARGSKYSLGHKFMDWKKDPRYWEFTHHEMGIYDLPAVFDYILKVTTDAGTNNPGKLYFVGHSLGTTMFYVCMSIHWKKYNNLIEAMVAIPPSAYLSRNTTPLRWLSPIADTYKTFPVQGPVNPETLNTILHFYLPELCRFKHMNQSLCSIAVFFLAGSSPKDIDEKVIQRVLGHYPSGLSIKTGIHLLQSVQKDRFEQFDYGTVKNFKVYNQTVPPKYNLYNINVRTLNVYGREDLIVDREDAEKNVAELGAGQLKNNVLVMDYNHIDLIWSRSAAPVINSRIVEFLKTLDVKKPLQNPSICQCRCLYNRYGKCVKFSEDTFCDDFKPLKDVQAVEQ